MYVNNILRNTVCVHWYIV